MPPKTKFTKEQLVNAAFQIAKEEGFDGITIRKVAKRIGSSIAPIYVNFNDLEELKQEVVIKTINLSQKLIEEQNSGDGFLDIGIASVIFAKEYPLLFNDVLLNNNTQYINPDEFKDFTINEMRKDPQLAMFDKSELELLLLKMKAFQGGLSILARMENYSEILTDDLIIKLLKDTGDDILNGMKQRI